MNDLISIEAITDHIYSIRGLRVMIDRDLAELYDVETKVLKQAVRRNKKRFPEDFMFTVTNQELRNLRSPSIVSSFIFADNL